MIGEFFESLKIGKIAESYAEEYFRKHNIKYEGVQDNLEYQKKDIDYLTSIGTVEVKMNFIYALKYHPGIFFWIETEVGNNKGFWYLTETDWFLFFDGNKNGILIQNNQIFKDFVNNLIQTGDREINRLDYKADKKRNGKIVTAKSMRLYLFQLENSGVNYQLIVNRNK